MTGTAFVQSDIGEGVTVMENGLKAHFVRSAVFGGERENGSLKHLF